MLQKCSEIVREDIICTARVRVTRHHHDHTQKFVWNLTIASLFSRGIKRSFYVTIVIFTTCHRSFGTIFILPDLLHASSALLLVVALLEKRSAHIACPFSAEKFFPLTV